MRAGGEEKVGGKGEEAVIVVRSLNVVVEDEKVLSMDVRVGSAERIWCISEVERVIVCSEYSDWALGNDTEDLWRILGSECLN